MATHVGTSGVVKVGTAPSDVVIAEVTGFTIDETNDTVEDTSLTDTAKSYKALEKMQQVLLNVTGMKQIAQDKVH